MILSHRFWLVPSILTVLSGCVSSEAQVLSTNEPLAMQSALTRGRLDLSCASLEAALISRQIAKPAVNDPLNTGEWEAVYTIGVTGCDRQATYRIVCPIGARCVAHPGVAPGRTGAAPSP
jgi:hypothetical protein